MFPITDCVVEDIKAVSKGQKRWDRSFSPLQSGKNWFYDQLKPFYQLHLVSGVATSVFRKNLGLVKSKKKLDDKFECHNVDSWVLANHIVGGHQQPDNKDIIKIVPMRLHRRQLHRFEVLKNGERKNYGGTRSLGFKRGSLVKYKDLGFRYIGGIAKMGLVLHDIHTGKRNNYYGKPEHCVFKTFLTFRREI
jgi:hypothetical protein